MSTWRTAGEMIRCGSCGFDNLDHVARCVRCGALLGQAELPPEQCIPPRAKRSRSFRKRLWAWRRRWGFRWPERTYDRGGERAAFDWNRLRPEPFWMPAILEFLGSWMLPSFYQFRHGRLKRAWLFLSLFLVGVGMMLLLLGSEWAGRFLLVAVLGHVCSICDIFQFEGYRYWERGAFQCCISFFAFLVLAGIYQVALEAWVRSWDSRVLGSIYRGPDLYAGEWVSFDRNPAVRLQPGDVVEAALFGLYRGGHGIMMYRGRIHNAVTVDRLIAVPGQRVAVRNGEILVDGAPSPVRPLRPGYRPAEAEEQLLNENEYLVYPSCSQQGGIPWPLEMALLRRDEIYGRAEAVIFPIWRRRALANHPNMDYNISGQ